MPAFPGFFESLRAELDDVTITICCPSSVSTTLRDESVSFLYVDCIIICGLSVGECNVLHAAPSQMAVRGYHAT